MHNFITKKQLVNFIFNNVNDEEREKIIEAINTNPEIKERYLYKKRIFDVERYIYGRIDIGERCEIEELIEKDSRLSDHFKLNIERINKEKQDVSINGEHITITKAQLVNFVLNNVNVIEYEKISEAIDTNSEIKERYLFEKRKYDVERFLNDKMDFGERCEIEEILKTDIRLFDYFELKKDINKEEQNTSINLMHIHITEEQLVNFVFNNVNEKEHKNIAEAINTNPITKERYLYEKRKYDVERYLDDEMDIGERCEIEELIKMDPRLFDYFKLNNGVMEEEQDESISPKQIAITKEQLVNFVLNDVNEEEPIEKYIEEYKKISEAINTNPLTKERYLYEKRKYDVERYLDDEMDFGERCEMEELLKINLRLYEYFELKKDVIEEEQNILINLMYTSITKEQLVNFIFNDVNDEEREKISEAINTKSLIKERYLFEKRKYDVERYIDDEMDIGERCEIEELIKMNPRLFDYFELNNGVMEEEQDESISLKQIDITKEQLVNFVLNNVNEEEHKKISEAINTTPVTKDRYLYEKRKYDVERYLDDEMDFGERCEMEELLKINLRLYEYFELNKGVNKFLEKTLKEELKNIHTELFDTVHNTEPDSIAPVMKLKPGILRIGKWVAAASIIITIGLGSVNIYLNNRDTVENRLYAKYYEPYSQMSAHLFNSSKLSEAKRLYGEGEYATSLLLLDNLQEVLLVQNEKCIYSGMALIELNRHKEAIGMFTKLHSSAGNETDVLIGYWYTGLCYLKIGDTENAIKYFKTIIANNGYNQKQAKEILEKLN